MLCDSDETKVRTTADILIPHKRTITSFLTPTAIGGRRPLPRKICALSETPPTSKNPDFDRFLFITSSRKRVAKKFNCHDRKSTTGFPTTYTTDEERTYTITSSKGGLKNEFVVFVNESQFLSNKACYKVFCVKTFSGTVVV